MVPFTGARGQCNALKAALATPSRFSLALLFLGFPNSLDALLNRIKQPEAALVAPGTAKPDKVHVHRPEENCA